MPTRSPLLRPRDSDALRAELRYVAAEGGVPVLFGGEVHGDALLLSEFVGTRTGLLRGLVVRSSSGLGGASMVAGRPMSVADYRNSSHITHDYDTPVLSEGIKSVLAVPVVVDGTARAMLYGAYRAGAPIGDRTADLMVASAHRLSLELTDARRGGPPTETARGASRRCRRRRGRPRGDPRGARRTAAAGVRRRRHGRHPGTSCARSPTGSPGRWAGTRPPLRRR